MRTRFAGFASADMHVYNPEDQSWTNISLPSIGTLPKARTSYGLAVCAGLLYIHGGIDSSGNE
jgi:hypothetical protein